MQKFWPAIALILAMSACAADPHAEQVAQKKRGKFSDSQFLCETKNIALWEALKAEGTDLSSYGLVCVKGSERTIIVRDSVILDDSVSDDTGDRDLETADAIGIVDRPTTDDADPPADDGEETPEDEEGEEATPPVETVTYSADLKVWIDEDCVGCHGAGGTSPRLDGYANARAAGAASLAAIQNNSMPLGASPWSPTDKAIFLAWSNAGFPE